MNIGSGDPSGIADGDLKRIGSDLYIRNGGSWNIVGGSGGMTTANGVGSSSGGTTTVTSGLNNGGAIMVIRFDGFSKCNSTNAGAVSWSGAGGGNNDSPSDYSWWAIGNQ